MRLTLDPLHQWPIGLGKPFIIAGPCSAESEDQVMKVASGLAPLNVQLFRSGIWKPRTRPGAFEGVGEIGLKWMQAVKSTYLIPVTVEVANAHHVEACLKHNIDVLWIGARTAANPFAVQEIADALQGINIPVMIKNPINPDLDLWIGAIERMNNAGLTRLLAVHRGFSAYENTKYRNKPNWEIPIELKRRYPEIPMICDPSHICGKTTLLQRVSQKALDLNFDGLMIETHTDPKQALSDAQQQITAEELGNLLQNLVLRESTTSNSTILSSLEELRNIIDEADETLLKLLSRRMDIVEKIGQFKKENNITILQPERWNEIVVTRTSSAKQKDLSEDLILKIFQLIHQESIRKQTHIMNREKEEGSEIKW